MSRSAAFPDADALDARDGMTRADFELSLDRDVSVLRPLGDWTALSLGDAPDRLARGIGKGRLKFDASRLGRVDTAGAFALLRLLDDREMEVHSAGRDDLNRLGELVRPALSAPPGAPGGHGAVGQQFDRIGRAVVGIWHGLYRNQVFSGQVVVALGRTIAAPRRLRTVPLVATMEQAGLAALPIVLVMTFFIGAVLALVGSNMLQTLGVTVYSVELVGIGILREFGAVIAAILFAGRSASAFAAQLGSMRMNQEIDAMQVMGVDLFDALVVPRVLAALIMLPIMTLAADIGGLAGGMLVSWWMMGIEPQFFLTRLVEAVGIQQFWVGIAKVPFFALVVSITGCRRGMDTEGNVESLGRNVTSAVVESIFLIIMFDALFAVLFRVVDQ